MAFVSDDESNIYREGFVRIQPSFVEVECLLFTLPRYLVEQKYPSWQDNSGCGIVKCAVISDNTAQIDWIVTVLSVSGQDLSFNVA